MCGISGIYAFNEKGKRIFKYLEEANNSLILRGPDNGNIIYKDCIAFGHRRLSIIDLSTNANQPMFDSSGRFMIVFNGEIFNYQILRSQLEKLSVTFKTQSDTEVILELFKTYGENFLPLLNGFFAFAIHDLESKKTFIARDRFGVKPLWYYKDNDVLIFASELKALLKFPIEKKINHTALNIYLQLNYFPQSLSVLEKFNKLEAGTYIIIENNKTEFTKYYSIPFSRNNISDTTYKNSEKELYNLLDESVKRRLIADVPVGAFLSGGIDSSVIVALASNHTNNLNTFSIGYKNDSYFDETEYAELVAKKFNTNHTTFSLTQDDVFNELDSILDYLDEPFADSSAMPVYVLSKLTRQKVKVALSGDGADEIFGGYIKHWAEYKMRNMGLKETLIKPLSPLWKLLPQSRNNKLGNVIRQLNRFSEGAGLTADERYWRWCSISSSKEASELFSTSFQSNHSEILAIQKNLTSYIDGNQDMNDVFANDMKLVLSGDMLTKVDLMSMANSLEVRTPFLDYTVVEWAFMQPSLYKVDSQFRKKILQTTFKNILPSQLFNRPKKGFEVPLRNWLINGLRNKIESTYLNRELVNEQKIFNYGSLRLLWNKLNSENPGDSAARIWAIVVFQHWYLKYIIVR